MFKSGLCIDCEKETARKNITKSITTISISVILAAIAYILFKKIDYIGNEHIYDFLNIIRVFFDKFVTIFDYLGIKVTDSLKNNLSMILCIYFLSSIPFGYYFLSKITNYSVTGGILGIIIYIYIKFVIVCFISPIVMPITIIFSIVSLIKSKKRLSAAIKQENKYISQIINNTPELKVPVK